MATNDPTNRPALPDATRLAIDRTRLAHERTLMAWVRTAVSLISFGFTIYKFFEGRPDANGHWLGYRGFSLLMLGTGLFSLIAATLQHRKDRLLLMQEYNVEVPSLAQVLAGMIICLGVFGLLAVIFRR
jgi:putative membrane protein